MDLLEGLVLPGHTSLLLPHSVLELLFCSWDPCSFSFSWDSFCSRDWQRFCKYTTNTTDPDIPTAIHFMHYYINTSASLFSCCSVGTGCAVGPLYWCTSPLGLELWPSPPSRIPSSSAALWDWRAARVWCCCTSSLKMIQASLWEFLYFLFACIRCVGGMSGEHVCPVSGSQSSSSTHPALYYTAADGQHCRTRGV